ncbi:MAG: PQQ-dependent sugar dehydrogenase [Chitinophagales bacterium]|nr:PQQ-dependent sugar dehydrogenase [Chitinophagales bacterium]
MKNNFALLLSLFFAFISCSFNSDNANKTEKESSFTNALSLKLIASNLEGPIGMAVPNDGSKRLFVIEQEGKIRIIFNGQLLPVPFLDVSSKLDHLNNTYSEKGLLGLAFHPQYKTVGKFYIYYSAPTSTKGMDNKSVIAEYTVSSNKDIANTAGKIILEIEEPESNHNGGQLAFGPDGYLYIGVGDGGGAGDKHGTIGNGQNLNTLLGKILRIDVDVPKGYSVPNENPFVNRNAKPEIYAYGLRNPWRFSFDKKTNRIFCGDVGQNDWEEVNVIEKGKNYGWRIMEGKHCYEPSQNCNTAGLTLPIDEYDHTTGISVIGGYVYNGTNKEMQGKYIFGDWKGKIFMLLKSAAENKWERRIFTIKNLKGELYINSFGEDENGELYVLGQESLGPKKAGKIFMIQFE